MDYVISPDEATNTSAPRSLVMLTVEKGSAEMNDQLEVTLEDSQLMDEISLVTDLMIAAVDAPGDLAQNSIDRILGVVDPVPSQRS